jgi:predicted CoA-substrate-specific enzyme activase
VIVAGIDIGSRASKAVVMNNGAILSSVIGDTGPESVKTSQMTMGKALQGTGFSLDDVQYVVATGYGRVLVPFANENISEISCHARGITWYYPSVRTILDMGGQDCKAISCDAEGRVTNFIMNDKCAGGTGRFLEMIAEVLNIPLAQIGEAALESSKPIPFNTICAVFAKSEAMGYLRRGVNKSDILAGLNDAIATRCLNLLRRITIEREFTITGGIAKNRGMVAELRQQVGLEPLLCADPQIVGALGAALFARERAQGKVTGNASRIQYGYSDGSGNYYIAIDTGRCDGCGECVPACPASVFEVFQGDGDQPKVMVKEEVRKKLALVCPGYDECHRSLELNCQRVCPRDAITHTW